MCNVVQLCFAANCVNETTLFSSCVKNGRSLRFPKIFSKKQTCNWWSNDKTIIELCYRKISWFFSVSRINIIICLRLRLPQISDLPSTGKSRYFAQPRPIIVNCVSEYLDCEQSLFCSKIWKGKYLSSEVARVTRARVAKARIRAKRESAMVSYSILDARCMKPLQSLFSLVFALSQQSAGTLEPLAYTRCQS